ncbi:redoxin domain-containing protein [Hyphococcus sp.]|uniref:redoxin domain-containing protein n=1 Tax=Hyphococcus sp. TaxID=2038636 RepID=UPI003CCC196A
MANTNTKPGKPAPDLSVSTQSGEWRLQKQTPETFTLVVFYRGLHCPLCKKQLEELNGKIGEFSQRGVQVIAISMDDEDRYKKTVDEWNVPDLVIGYNLNEATARNWGLFLSGAISDQEPSLFSEPGLFFVDSDGALYSAAVQSNPFARPRMDDVLKAIDIIKEKDYPPRGVVG